MQSTAQHLEAAVALEFPVVHSAIDQHTQDTLTGLTIIYTGQDDLEASNGQASWVKQKVLFSDSKQFELGNTASSRNWGKVVIYIYTRKGSGSADRDNILQRVVNCYRSRKIGGATFLNVQPLTNGESENWCVSGFQIPFYFNSI